MLVPTCRETTCGSDSPKCDRPGVPDHHSTVFRPKASHVALIIPVINEGDRIRRQLTAIHEDGIHEQVDVVIADGGSTDGSVESGFLLGAGVRARLTKLGPGRQGAQFRMALAWALAEGYEIFVTMDGNGKDGIDGILRIAEKVAEGYDYVQGSRYHPEGRAINTPLARKLLGRFVHAPVCSLSAGARLTDTTNGFRGYSRDLLEGSLEVFRDCFSGYEFLFYISCRAARFGYAVTEVPVTRSYPASGKVPTKMTSLGAKLGVFSELWRCATGHYDPVRYNDMTSDAPHAPGALRRGLD